MVNEDFIINRYLGISYKHKGRGLDGLDCGGLILRIYTDLGYLLPDIAEDYDENWSWRGKSLFIENYYKLWEKVENYKLFDVVLFLNSKKVSNHAGVMLRRGRFIHTCKAGTIISKISDLPWVKRFGGFYHLRVKDDRN